MQQSEILSLTEKLIPAYHADDFEHVLLQLTDGVSPSAKLLVKMELNRIMTPSQKRIDLRGRLSQDCQEYLLDGLSHWLDDRAFNQYHKLVKKFGGYTEGVWESLVNQPTLAHGARGKPLIQESDLTDPNSPFEAEPINLGYDLLRRENRLKLTSQVTITLNNGETAHGVTVDLSGAGAKFKVPGTFDYNLGEVISVSFDELAKDDRIKEIQKPIEYRVLGVEGIHGVSPVKFLRTLRLTSTNAIEQVVEQHLNTETKKIRHDNQDKITRARTRGFEHTYLKHACNLPLFFSGEKLKVALLTENNHNIWNYWHDERNQQAIGNLFSPERMALLVKAGIKGCSNVLYSFTHEHQGMTLFYSMMMPEASREERQLFWHVGAKKKSWRAFHLSVFELSEKEISQLSAHSSELAEDASELTHCGILREISDDTSALDYLLTEKPRLASSELGKFRHPRKTIQPRGIYFDALSRRKEPRYQFRSPLKLLLDGQPTISAHTTDISKRGLSIELEQPLSLATNSLVHVDYIELKLYNDKLALNRVPYRVVRLSDDFRQVHLAIEENGKTIKTIAFLNGIIENNQETLVEKEESLPSAELLESMHNVLLSKMVSTPIYVDRRGSSLKTRAIGVNYPLPGYLQLFERLGHNKKLSLQPIFKGRSNSLLVKSIKKRPGAEPIHYEVYIAALKFGDRIQAVHSKLRSDFPSARERIQFVKHALSLGELYVLRLSCSPVFDPLTVLLRKDINELLALSLTHARNLENEMSSIHGYCELVDITEEVLIRLELN